jgi:hypothetical protein
MRVALTRATVLLMIGWRSKLEALRSICGWRSMIATARSSAVTSPLFNTLVAAVICGVNMSQGLGYRRMSLGSFFFREET